MRHASRSRSVNILVIGLACFGVLFLTAIVAASDREFLSKAQRVQKDRHESLQNRQALSGDDKPCRGRHQDTATVNVNRP
jgi:hypothetical protein